jgi:uncharacterized protein (DUF2236 family)
VRWPVWQRTHRRLAGTDEQGRPFTALDPAVRVWVLVTLYECMTTMRELSGRPLAPSELDQTYGEFRAVCSEFGLSDDLFPATAADVPAYMDRTIRERLQPIMEAWGELRYVVEQTFALLHRFKRLAVRWERRTELHDAFGSLACSLIGCRRLNKPDS